DGARPSVDAGLAAHGREGGQPGLDLRQELQGRRQGGELLALEELLHPPVRIVGIGDPGDGLARTLEVLELPGLAGIVDELLDPGIPALPCRLALRHGASSRANPRLVLSPASPPYGVGPRENVATGDPRFRPRSIALRV